MSGSSPLARGLRDRIVVGRRERGIIPARAGFTPDAPGDRRRHEDHPRSRGVYHRRNQWQTTRPSDHPRSRGVYPLGDGVQSHERGSSPLARGLHEAAAQADLAGRIIPARAGFTRPSSRPGPGGPDHPRSRGVYIMTAVQVVVAWGSSPLARGLLDDGRGAPTRSGIIPARAGFTVESLTTRRISADHPRSRGVYARPGRTSTASPGSSPLARGLLE